MWFWFRGIMGPMDTQKFRDTLIDRAALAFAQDKLDEAGFEAFVARVQTASGELELRGAAADLAPLVPVEDPAPTLAEHQEVTLSMSNLKKKGPWVEARSYRLEGKMSNFELDYLAYAESRDFQMRLSVDLTMSNLKLIVPPDWRVDCRMGRLSGSNVVDRGSPSPGSSNRIVVEGDLSMSNIMVKRRDPNRRSFFARLFGR